MSAVIENIDTVQESLDGFLIFGTGAEGDATVILPGATSDVIFTSSFLPTDDQVDAGFLNDVISTGDGDDTITGGNGDDVLAGGTGADVFIFEFFGNEQSDAILDFNLSEDEIRFINEENEELTVSNSFFINNGIGDGELSVEIDDEGNLSINDENVDDDDFELL